MRLAAHRHRLAVGMALLLSLVGGSSPAAAQGVYTGPEVVMCFATNMGFSGDVLVDTPRLLIQADDQFAADGTSPGDGAFGLRQVLPGQRWYSFQDSDGNVTSILINASYTVVKDGFGPPADPEPDSTDVVATLLSLRYNNAPHALTQVKYTARQSGLPASQDPTGFYRSSRIDIPLNRTSRPPVQTEQTIQQFIPSVGEQANTYILKQPGLPQFSEQLTGPNGYVDGLDQVIAISTDFTNFVTGVTSLKAASCDLE